MMRENALRGKVIAMYGTVLNFARTLNWSSRKTYEIINGKQLPSGKDIDEMCTALNVEIPAEMRTLFQH